MKTLLVLFSQCLIALCFVQSIASSQTVWKWQNPLPQGNTLDGVSFSDPKHGFAVGRAGTILHTTNGGDTWALQSAESQDDFTSVCVFDSNTALVSGGIGGLLKTTDGGPIG